MTIDTSSLWPALEFALIGGAVSTVIGGALGSIAGTVEVPWRRWCVAMSVVLLAAPPAFWWIGFTKLPIGSGAFSGLLWGSVVAGIALAPISLLFVLAATREIPANAYEAARLSLPPARRVWHVLLPLLNPALAAGFLLTAILLLGESEVPFLFGFRTSMTDVVTTFSQTFDATRTAPIVIPLVVAVLMLALTIVIPLFRVLLSTSGANRGVVRKRAHSVVSAALLILPVVLLSAAGGYVLAAIGGDTLIWQRVSGWSVVAPSIAESVLCSLSALCIGIVVAYPVRRSSVATGFAVVGLLLFCIPTAVTALVWIVLGQALGGVSFPPSVAHVSRLTGLALLGFLVAYSRLPRSLEDAAQLVSLSPPRRAWSLMLPLMRPSFAAIAALTAALVFADRDVASLLLSPGESRTMLNLYLVSANAPSALVGMTALIVLATGAVVIGLSAAVPALVLLRTRD